MKNGFTMIELLGVIVLLALLMAVAVPSVLTISEKMQVDMFCEKLEFIEKGAQTWGQDNYDYIWNFENSGTVNEVCDTEGERCTVTVNELYLQNYLKKDGEDESGNPMIESPYDNSNMMDRVVEVYIKNTRIYAEVVPKESESGLCE